MPMCIFKIVFKYGLYLSKYNYQKYVIQVSSFNIQIYNMDFSLF